MSRTNYTFNIIHEAVSAEDAFTDKTHEKVAESLVDLIKSSEKGVTIGLEGGWGSGKSTVVNLLRKQLVEQNDDTLFFLFDAWAHEGDPLRRIFLESLIEEIDPEEKDEDLQYVKKSISGKKKTVEVTTKKSASTLGGWLSFSAIFVPVGAAILSAVDYSELGGISLDREFHIQFLIGLLLGLAPLIPLAIWRLIGTERDEKRSYKFLTWLFLGNKKWDVFESDSEEKYTQDISEDGERTSIEFQQFFKEIMGQSIGDSKKYKRALIIVDNLDRVEAEQTLAIWSILQTFFQHRNAGLDNGDGWATKIWFLIPHDRDGLSRVWNRAKYIPSSKSGSELGVSNIVFSPDESIAPSFLEKCFQVIAEVPEPVMSAWVEYSEKNIRDALVGWPVEEVDTVIEIFTQFESRLESSPTPRQVLSFINRLGLLGLRFGGEMSPEAMAVYALVRRNRSDKELRRMLLDFGLPDNYQARNNDQELKRELAGMLFGVSKEKGIQLLLQPEIRSALNSADSENLSLTMENHGDAFWVVWEAISSQCIPNGHTEEYKISATLAFCKAINSRNTRAKKSIKKLCAEWMRADSDWSFEKYDYSESLEALISVLDTSGDLLEWLKTKLKDNVQSFISGKSDDGYDVTAMSNIDEVFKLLVSNGVKFEKVRYGKLGQEGWRQWDEAIADNNLKLSFVLPKAGVIESLAGAINNNSPDPNTADLLSRTLDLTPESKEWEVVADSLHNWAVNPEHQPNNNESYRLMLKIYKRCGTAARTKISNALKQPGFFQAINKDSVESVPDLLALCAIFFNSKLLESEIPDNLKLFWKGELSTESSEPVIRILTKYEELPVVWQMASDENNQFAVGVIRGQNNTSSLFGSANGPLYIDEMTWASGEELQLFVSKFEEYGAIVKASEDLLNGVMVNRFCFEIFAKYGNSETKRIVKDAINKLTSDLWVESLGNDLSHFNCLVDKGNHEFKDGVIKIINKELEDGDLTPHFWENIKSIFAKVMDPNDVSKALADKYFLEDVDSLSDEAFNQVWSIIEERLSSINSDQFMYRLEYWLGSANWSRIEAFLETNTKFKEDLKESLVSRIVTLSNEFSGEPDHIVFELAKYLGVDMDRKDEGEDPQESKEELRESDQEQESKE